MRISRTLLEVLIRSRTVSACMKRITGFCGSIKTGGLVWRKLDGLEGYHCRSSVLWPTMSTGFSGTSIRQVLYVLYLLQYKAHIMIIPVVVLTESSCYRMEKSKRRLSSRAF